MEPQKVLQTAENQRTKHVQKVLYEHKMISKVQFFDTLQSQAVSRVRKLRNLGKIHSLRNAQSLHSPGVAPKMPVRVWDL